MFDAEFLNELSRQAAGNAQAVLMLFPDRVDPEFEYPPDVLAQTIIYDADQLPKEDDRYPLGLIGSITESKLASLTDQEREPLKELLAEAGVDIVNATITRHRGGLDSVRAQNICLLNEPHARNALQVLQARVEDESPPALQTSSLRPQIVERGDDMVCLDLGRALQEGELHGFFRTLHRALSCSFEQTKQGLVVTDEGGESYTIS